MNGPAPTNEHPPQFSLWALCGLWAAVAIPMPLLAFWVAPKLSAASGWHPGIALWLCMIVGMVWQFVLATALLWRESRRDKGRLTLGQRIWWQLPRDPGTGAMTLRPFIWLVPIFILTPLIEVTGLADLLARPLLWIAPALAQVPEPDIRGLADPAFHGAWWLLGLWAISFIFNYFLGEELFFRGLLLPRMRGVFGRWDWLANGVFFGTYHLIRPLTVPSIIVTAALWALPCARYRSALFAVIPHAVEGLFVLFLVLGVVTGALP